MRKHLVRAMLLGLSVAVGTGAYGPAEAASHQKAKKHPATVAAKTPAKATKTAKTEKGEKSRKLARSAKTGAKLALAGSAAVVTHHAIRHASAAPDDLGAARRLAVQSSAAMVLDQSSGEVIYQKNATSIMPTLDAANISFNLLKSAAGDNLTVGPILLGPSKAVHILTPTATVRRIVNMTALTVVDAHLHG